MLTEYLAGAWFYNGTFVTTRVTALLSAQAITAINTYFSVSDQPFSPKRDVLTDRHALAVAMR